MSIKTKPTLEHVGICVPQDKYAQTIAFYEQVFGWHKVHEVPGRITFLGDGEGGRMEIIINDVPPLPKPHHVAFVLPIEELDEAVRALTEAGAQCDPVSQSPTGDSLVFFLDPAGNYMQLVCRNSPLPR